MLPMHSGTERRRRHAVDTWSREGRTAGSGLCHASEFRGGFDQRVDDLSGAGGAVAGREQRVDVTTGELFSDRAYGHAPVVADEQARDPADADSANDQAACGERVARGRRNARVESGVAAGLDEVPVGGGDDPVVVGELLQ